MVTNDVLILTGGELRFIWTDDFAELASLGEANIRRVSHVEPTDDGRWEADMSPVEPGVVLGPFKLRSDALAAEIEWLKDRGY